MYPLWHEFLAAAVLDAVLGDPRRLPHPVRWIGRLVSLLERLAFRWCHAGWLRPAGALLVLTVVVPGTAGAWLLPAVPDGPARSLAVVYLTFALLALGSLDKEAREVVTALEREDLPGARRRLSGIVGRDTEELNEKEIMRAVTETVAENLSDGVIAPLFYLAVAGLPGMVAYKCINTLDSMIGYRNERYRDLGWAAARLDDLANFIPARLTALLVLLAGALLGLSASEGWRVVRRDAPTQPSPNAGYPEAAVAGLLGVRLGGANRYGEAVVQKPFLGDPLRQLQTSLYPELRRLLYLAAALAYGAALLHFYRMEHHV